MKRRQGWLFFIIFLLTLSVYLLINYPLQLGLDLRGGSQLTLQIIKEEGKVTRDELEACLLYTSPSPRDIRRSRMPSSA